MKINVKRHIAFTMALLMLVASGCSDVLKEQPRSGLVPSFYSTATGINAGLTAAYASYRYYYGVEGGMNLEVYGTDEFTHGQQQSNPPLSVYAQLTSNNTDILTPWGRGFSAINTCNAVIQLGSTNKDLSATQKANLLAEAKFLRANWYFILVTTFGGVPLDLGSGKLAFNTTPTNVASRASTAEVYDAIIQDLIDASTDLPDKPAAPGKVWKASALHLLSKVYLTRGWSADAKSDDFANALATAETLITNKATYGVDLEADYANVHKEGNEYGKEILFQIDWIDNQTFNNTNGFLGGDEALRQNRSNFLFRMFYNSNMPGMVRDIPNGRSFVRYKPTPWLLDVAFGDKINDTRYNKSFQTVWYCNSPSTLNPKNLKVGDTAIWCVPNHLESKMAPFKDSKPYAMFLPNSATDPRIYFNDPNSKIVNWAAINKQNEYYPTLTKYNSTQPRANNDVNISSVRPFIVYRFAETYLIAAEAAFKLSNTAKAATYINVIRTRAAANAGAATMMTANTETDLIANGIDYILDERTRELAGEQMRWMDLVRTGSLIRRVNLYNNFPALPGSINPDGSTSGTPQLVPNPQSFHVLRPIPQSQIDGAVDPTTTDHKFPQNPGY